MELDKILVDRKLRAFLEVVGARDRDGTPETEDMV